MNSLPKEWIVLAGNPNTGKTAIFNLLTGLHQKVSNYPGITVEKKFGIIDLLDEKSIHILDLPGSYSLTSETFDEHVVSDEIFSWIYGEEKPSLILSVVDVENLSRNLYLTSQLLDLGIPVIVVLNMMDRIQEESLILSPQQLKERLGAADVIPVSAIEKMGMDRLKDSILTNLKSPPNVDEEDILKELMDEIIENSNNIPIIFPVHPRTEKQLESLGISYPNLHTVEPLSYLEFNYLVERAKAVITDSGGITEEVVHGGGRT